ncbi:MAG: hypothetical protein RMM53_03650, partial [Bacteroidia bacterium]|nr:hypothetical protein [Bacteroidia bacterium]
TQAEPARQTPQKTAQTQAEPAPKILREIETQFPGAPRKYVNLLAEALETIENIVRMSVALIGRKVASFIEAVQPGELNALKAAEGGRKFRDRLATAFMELATAMEKHKNMRNEAILLLNALRFLDLSAEVRNATRELEERLLREHPVGFSPKSDRRPTEKPPAAPENVPSSDQKPIPTVAEPNPKAVLEIVVEQETKLLEGQIRIAMEALAFAAMLRYASFGEVDARVQTIVRSLKVEELNQLSQRHQNHIDMIALNIRTLALAIWYRKKMWGNAWTLLQTAEALQTTPGVKLQIEIDKGELVEIKKKERKKLIRSMVAWATFVLTLAYILA